ncbi:hypothetical protein ACFRCW_28305 [Streptomyces sp. NPDC056653]|uniref:hypothetical protein n=1 Tax=Streptomyces sp. NPDC056653 TaxID=3345894 RepID=UPI0036B59218
MNVLHASAREGDQGNRSHHGAYRSGPAAHERVHKVIVLATGQDTRDWFDRPRP